MGSVLGRPTTLDFKVSIQCKLVGISVYVDTDFAGCRATRRSTSGGVLSTEVIPSNIGLKLKQMCASHPERRNFVGLVMV